MPSAKRADKTKFNKNTKTLRIMQKQGETWRFIPGMNEQYQINDKGEVKRLKRMIVWNKKEKELPEIIIKQRRNRIKIKGKEYKVSELMKLAGFNPPLIDKKKPKLMKRSYNKRIGFGINNK